MLNIFMNDTMKVTHIKLLNLLILVGWLTSGCSDKPEDEGGGKGQLWSVKTQLASYIVNGEESALPGENSVNDMKACLFEDGVLKQVYSHIQGSGNQYNFTVESNQGNLYLLANTSELIDWNNLKVGETNEKDWQNQIVETKGDQHSNYFSGHVQLGGKNANQPVEVLLQRGCARVDVKFNKPGIQLHHVQLRNVARRAYLFPQESISSPDEEVQDLEYTWEEALTSDTRGIAYLHEQANGGIHVILKIYFHGGTQILETQLPGTIKRNTVYTLIIDGDDTNLTLSVNIDEWEEGSDIIMNPDFEDKITIDESNSNLPGGAFVSEKGDELTLPHPQSEFILALNCNDQLEVSQISDASIEITSLERTEGKNRFLVKKRLMAIGHKQAQNTISFRRKGLNQIYEEDKLTVILEANPTTVEGILTFNKDNYTCDFADYKDGEFGTFHLPEGYTMEVEFEEGEDAWMCVRQSEGESNTYRVLGGWRPNDPKADGRIQKGKIVIHDNNTGDYREEYIVIRRNYGLPVVQMNGIWWCKYNAMGQSNNFEDQILVPEDPAEKAQMSVYEYLNTCSVSEYLRLWGWSYQDASGKGLKIIAQNNAIKLDGYTSNGSVNINHLSPTALSPSGYELPDKAYYDRIFASWWMRIDRDGGPYNVQSPWEGNRQVFVTSGQRTDLILDGVIFPTTYHFEVYDKMNNTKAESVTFYGPGDQWGNGGINHNKILFGCHSLTSGWFNAFTDNEGLRQSGGGANDTRILRFIKTPVEYIY